MSFTILTVGYQSFAVKFLTIIWELRSFFLHGLIEKYLALEDEPCRIEMRKEILRFIDQHLLPWIPHWNEQMQEHATTLCYKGIGTLIHACIEDINSLLSHPENTLE